MTLKLERETRERGCHRQHHLCGRAGIRPVAQSSATSSAAVNGHNNLTATVSATSASGHGGTTTTATNEDDLNDLMEVFDFFDVFDANEAQDLEREIGRDRTQSGGFSAASFLANGAPTGAASALAGGGSSSASAAGLLHQQFHQRKHANGASTQSIAQKGEAIGSIRMEVEHAEPETSPTTSTASSPVPGQSSSAPAVVKQKRGRKKKEEVLAIAAAAAAAAGVPFPPPPSADAGLAGGSEEERDRLRRESNKQSARNSRKKKKEYVLVLGESIASLTKEVQQLRSDLAKRSAEDDRRDKLACIGRNAFLQALESHGPTSSRRRVSAMYQFENLTRNVAPPHTRFLLWSVARKATEADSAAARTWQEVSSVIGLQPEQQDRFAVLMRSKKATDHAAAEERDKLQYVFTTMQKLRSGMEQSATRISAFQTALLDILTPVQQALLYQYIEETHAEQAANAHGRSFVFNSNPNEALLPDVQKVRQYVSTPVPNPSRHVSQQEEANTIDFLLNLR